MRKMRLLLCISVSMMLLMLAGCLQGEQTLEEIDVPENIDVIDETEDENTENEVNKENKENEANNDTDVEESDEMVERVLYLFDVDGVVAPVQLELPKTEATAEQAVQYLVENGPVKDIIPEGFEAVLPEGTEVLGTNMTDEGILIVDVSDEFSNYETTDEVKILEAMTHTLTQFENVEQIKLRINGVDMDEMPVNGTPIANGYGKDKGINIHVDEKPHLQYSELVTFYYPKKHDTLTYFVPVSMYMDKETNTYETVVQKLLEGGPHELGLQNVFHQSVSLEKATQLEEGVLQLVFNEYMLNDDEQPIIQKNVMETLVRSLVDGEEIKAIDVKVEHMDEILDEDGNVYNAPVQLSDFQVEEKM